MKKLRTILMIGLIAMASFRIAQAAEDHMKMPPMKPASAEFERVKALKGVWEGTSTTDGKVEKEKARVEYSLTSGGSAVVEKLFPGTPHEMVSVYYDKSGKLEMTHYCMLGNRPHLKLKSADAGSMAFTLASKDSGIAKKEQHMHSLKLDFPDAKHLTQNWTCFDKGKPHQSTVIALTRVK